MTPVDEQPYRFEWRQDSRQRVLKLTGSVDGSTVAQLRSGIIDLGGRRLVIDLTDVTSIDESGTSTLVDLSERLGPGRVTVLPGRLSQFGPGDI